MTIFQFKGKILYYTHIPKTGGSYILNLLLKNGFSRHSYDGNPGRNRARWCSPQHMHYEMASGMYKWENFDYIFATVRDPQKRIISEFHEQIRLGNVREDDNINEWILEALYLCNKDPFVFDNHLRPQHEFLGPNVDWFKQESGFNSAWMTALLAKKLKMDFNIQEVGKNRVSTPKEFTLDDSVAESIVRFYIKDYIKFGYSPPMDMPSAWKILF